MIKKIVFHLLSILLGIVVCGSMKVYAEVCESLTESSDYEEVVGLTEEIVLQTNHGPVDTTKTRCITEADIDFEHAVKEYLNPPIIKEHADTSEEVKAVLSECNYMWIVPIRADGYLYEVCINRPVNDEFEIIGGWECGMIYCYEQGALTLQEQLDKTLKRNAIDPREFDFILAGGIDVIQEPVYLALKNSKAEYMLPARESTAFRITDSSKGGKSVYSGENLNGAEGFQAYDYKKVADTIRSMDSSLINIGAGTGTIIDIGKSNVSFGTIFVIALTTLGTLALVYIL